MTEIKERAKFAIAYLAYGLESTKYQAILSIYSLCHHVGVDIKDFLIVIYTDSDRRVLDKHLAGLPVELEVLSKEQVKQFRGADDYVFRIKPLIIKNFFSKYKINLLYLDTDTYFLRNPISLLKTITPGYSIMNIEEYNFVDAGTVEPLHWFNLRQALKRYKYSVKGKEVIIPISTTMWNAGIIGISYNDSYLVDDIISLTDEMYSKCYTFIVEQFAASYILQSFTELKSTEDYIEHYWSKGLKNVYNVEIPIFLKKNSGTTGQALYAAAYAFALATSKMPHINTQSLLGRINNRIKVILKVARKGHL